jgi:hypothetical protein
LRGEDRHEDGENRGDCSHGYMLAANRFDIKA